MMKLRQLLRFMFYIYCCQTIKAEHSTYSIGQQQAVNLKLFGYNPHNVEQKNLLALDGQTKSNGVQHPATAIHAEPSGYQEPSNYEFQAAQQVHGNETVTGNQNKFQYFFVPYYEPNKPEDQKHGARKFDSQAVKTDLSANNAQYYDAQQLLFQPLQAQYAQQQHLQQFTHAQAQPEQQQQLQYYQNAPQQQLYASHGDRHVTNQQLFIPHQNPQEAQAQQQHLEEQSYVQTTQQNYQQQQPQSYPQHQQSPQQDQQQYIEQQVQQRNLHNTAPHLFPEQANVALHVPHGYPVYFTPFPQAPHFYYPHHYQHFGNFAKHFSQLSPHLHSQSHNHAYHAPHTLPYHTQSHASVSQFQPPFRPSQFAGIIHQPPTAAYTRSAPSQSGWQPITSGQHYHRYIKPIYESPREGTSAKTGNEAATAAENAAKYAIMSPQNVYALFKRRQTHNY